MKRTLETGMEKLEEILAYDSLKTLDMVNDFFLQRALELCSRGRILDVGCGTGKTLRNIKGDYELHGIDVNEQAIAHAKSQGKDISYKTADSNSLPYAAGCFDLVMCHSLLHHLDNPRKTIEEIQRVAKPEGAVFIRDLSRPHSEEILQALFLDTLAAHYDETNKRLFENSLRSSFAFEEWQLLFPADISTSMIFFYNVAERIPAGTELDENERRLKEIEFVQRRLNAPLAYNK